MKLRTLSWIYFKYFWNQERRYQSILKEVSELSSVERNRLIAECKDNEASLDGGGKVISFAAFGFAFISEISDLASKYMESRTTNTILMNFESFISGTAILCLLFIVTSLSVITGILNPGKYAYIKHILEQCDIKPNADSTNTECENVYVVRIKREE